MKTKNKRFLSLFLAFALVLSVASAKPQKADAIATGAVVTAIISVAIGSGLAFVVDRMTSPEVDAYWTGQAQQWLQSTGQSYSDFVEQAEQNMSSKDGKLILGGSFYQSIQNFLSWWKTENSISAGQSDPVVAFSNSGGIRLADGSILPVDTTWNEVSKTQPTNLRYFLTGLDNITIDFASGASFIADSSRTKFVDATGREYYAQTRRADQSFFFYFNGTSIGIGYKISSWTTWTKLGEITDFVTYSGASSLSVSQPSDDVVLEPTEALPNVALDVGASSEDDLETVIRSVLDGYIDNILVVGQELTEIGAGEGTDTDGIFGILHGISGTLSDVLDAVLSIPATLAGVFSGFIGSIGNFISGAFYGFSGIWYYVVTWVNSMRSGASLIFTVWSELPYGMVVPVYASLVAVIVIGLWKRFFG